MAYTPTLTGMGERAHLARPGVDLETHIEDVLAVLRWEDLDDAILLGHSYSYSGAVVTGVADHAPERLRRLVYLDAFVRLAGQSQLECLPPPARPPRSSSQPQQARPDAGAAAG